MLVYRQLKDGTFVACETEKGIVEIAPARSFWARQAERRPAAIARAMINFNRPDPASFAGREIAKRNRGMLMEMRKYAQEKAFGPA